MNTLANLKSVLTNFLSGSLNSFLTSLTGKEELITKQKGTIMNTAKIVFTVSFIAMTAFIPAEEVDRTVYNVSGIAQLEDQMIPLGDHSGVQVKFYNLPSMVAEDSTTTNTDGDYSINISPGYYLVEWTKAGYVPWELGGLSLAENTVLDSVIMIPGEVSEVSGTINSTTWTTSYVYYVTDDITVPAGQTLTINPGVRVKFLEGKSMTVNGTLLANGSADAHVKFTSKEPTPLPGDWGNLTLNGENNVITYMDYDFATDGITGNNATGTSIDHLTIQGNLALSANGIKFDGGESYSFTNNFISIGGSYGIYINGANNSEILNNIIATSNEYGVRADDSDNSSFDGNEIIGRPYYGIYSRYNENSSFSNNSMEVGNIGFHCRDGDSLTFTNNTVTEFEDHGIYFYSTENTSIIGNNLTSHNSNTSSKYGIYNEEGGSNAIIRSNVIFLPDVESSSKGIYCHNAIIDSNIVTINAGWSSNHCIAGNENIITNNTLFIQSNYDSYVINTSGSESTQSQINNNTITFDFNNRNTSYGILASHATVSNNTINGVDDRAIYFNGGNVTFENNVLTTNHKGIITENTNATIRGNILNTGGRCIEMGSSSSGQIYNNTLVSESGDYGVYQSNQTNVPVYNNIITGFNKGIYVDNTIQNYNLAHNLFWDIDAQLFEGSALPPLVGNMIDQNANGLSSDIYNNIEFDPLFVEPDSNDFTLQAASPAVNAGDGTMTDPDGSVSDIGAHYYHIYVAMTHTPLGNTDDINGPYRVNGTIVSTDGLTPTGSVFYSVDGGDFTEIAMTDAGSDAFYADIPGQALNTTVQYYLSGTDGTHTSTMPFNVSNGGYSFFVSLFSQFANMSGNSTSNGDIELTWGTPTPISGTLTGIKLYKSLNPNVALVETNLIQELDASATTFTDTDTEEGIAYYYKLTGVLDSGTEALVSAEVSVVSDNSILLRIMGVVQLADATFPPDHSGVKVLMEAVSPTAASDSMVTAVTGEFNMVLSNGMYHIHFTKDGYQPITHGDMFLAVTTIMDTLILERGGSRSISGDISGTLSGDTLYFVVGDLTVPQNETLIVEAGTQVLFKGDYSFNSNGLLLVNGTENNMVSFTSGAFSPAAGDWGGLNIYQTNSEINYANIKYSTSALYVSNVDTITVNGCVIKNTTVGSDGIRLYEPQYAKIRNNTIDAPNACGIRKVNSNNDDSGTGTYGYEIVSNTIVADRGIYIKSTHDARVDSNTIYVETNYGIHNESGQNAIYTGNSILPSGDQYEVGFYVHHADGGFFRNNTVNNAHSVAFYLYDSSNDSLINNTITFTGSDDNWVSGFHEYSDNNYFYGNDITLYKENNHFREIRGFYAWGNNSHNNEYVKNRVKIGSKEYGYYNGGFYNLGSNAVLKENYVELYNTSPENGWVQSAISGISYSSTNDTLIIYNTSRGMTGNNITATGAIISAPEHHYSGYEAIYVSSGEAVLENVSITGVTKGLTASGAGADLKKVTIETSGDYAIYASGTGRTVNVEQSTFVSNNENGTGLHLEEGVSINMNSTVVDGYSTGLHATSEATLYSNLLNNSSNYTGSGIADGTGVDNYFNINGDGADMFVNLQMNPQFVDRDGGDYHPAANSPLINAGSASMPDPDGTLPDIGSHFFNFGYTPKDLTTVSTGDGTVTLSWSIIETDSLTGYQPYYKLATEDTWTATLMPATEMVVEYTNLTNNAVYDFAVSALYLITESNLSPAYQERPGIPELTVTPQQQVVVVDQSEFAEVIFNIGNTGSKDLTFSLDAITGFTGDTPDGFSSLGIFNGHQYFYYQNSVYWTTARDICESFGGHIVVINSAEENEFIRQSINGSETWLGITEEESEGTWLWYNNEPVTYTNWDPGEPNGNSDYGYMHGNGTWDDADVNIRFVMEEVRPTSNFSQSEGVIAPGEIISITDTTYISNNGISLKQIALESNDPTTPTDTIQALVISGLQANLPSEYFTPTDTTNNVFYYAITSASIDDDALETGDEVAIFDGDVCVGAGMYNGVMPFLVRAWGIDPPDEPGFENGNVITVKAWDFGESRIASMEATHISGNETFLSEGFAEVSLTGTIFHSQDITIQGDMFNLISYYLYPELPSSSTFFSGLVGLRIVYEDNGSAYIPEYGVNTIGDITLTEGYHVFFTGEDQILTYSGLTITPSNWSLTLEKQRFNSVAYLYDAPMDAEVAFAAIADAIQIVQDDAGNAWIPDLGITLGNLIPGKGYQVFTDADTNIVFTYPEYVSPSMVRVLADGLPKKPRNFHYIATGLPYTIAIPFAKVDHHALSDGDEIGVFDGELCVGATVWNSNTPNYVTAWKAYPEGGVPGYQAGNDISFKVYKPKFKAQVDMDVDFTQASQKQFDGAPYSVAKLNATPGIIPEKFALKQNYPNPFNPVTTIAYDVADYAEVDMVVYNLLGEEVIRLVNAQHHEPGRYHIKWGGRNALGANVSSGVYLVHMRSGEFSSTMKMILLK